MKTIKNIVYAQDDPMQLLDVYLPENDVESAFLYFHGGGMIRGDKSAAEVFASYLTDHGIAVVSVDYRMYPDAKYPDFICDAALSAGWTYRYMKENHACDKLFIGGTSAGGYLSMMLCFDPTYLAQAGMDNSKIAGYLHNSGQPTAHFKVLEERGIDPKRVIIDESAPIYHVGTEEKYPPMRFIVSDNDAANRYEQTMLMMGTLKNFGYSGCDCVVVPGKHTEHNKSFDENGVNVFGKMVYDFIQNIFCDI